MGNSIITSYLPEIYNVKKLLGREISLLYNLVDDPISHGIEHAASVTLRSLEIIKSCKDDIIVKAINGCNRTDVYENVVDPSRMIIIALYHDVGLIKGREGHEKLSGKILKMNKEIRRYYGYDLDMMVEAIEDHRASLEGDPRSIYGKILSQADRGYSLYNTINRSIAYTAANHPYASSYETCKISFEHLVVKYGVGGYAWEHEYFLNDFVHQNFKNQCIKFLAMGLDYFVDNYAKFSPSKYDVQHEEDIKVLVNILEA